MKRVVAGLLALATTVGPIDAASAIQKSGDAMDEEIAKSNKKAIEDHQAEKDIADYNAKHKDNFVTSYDDNGRLKVIKIQSNEQSYESTVKGARN